MKKEEKKKWREERERERDEKVNKEKKKNDDDELYRQGKKKREKEEIYTLSKEEKKMCVFIFLFFFSVLSPFCYLHLVGNFVSSPSWWWPWRERKSSLPLFFLSFLHPTTTSSPSLPPLSLLAFSSFSSRCLCLSSSLLHP